MFRRGLQYNGNGVANEHPLLGHGAIICEDLYSRILRCSERRSELGLGAVVGGKIGDALHLYDKENRRLIACLAGFDELLHVAKSPKGGSVGEEGVSILSLYRSGKNSIAAWLGA